MLCPLSLASVVPLSQHEMCSSRDNHLTAGDHLRSRLRPGLILATPTRPSGHRRSPSAAIGTTDESSDGGCDATCRIHEPVS